MSLCVDTEVAVREAVNQAVCEVFQMMTGTCILPVPETYETDTDLLDEQANPKLTVILGLTGGIQGSLCLSLTEPAAMHWAETILFEKFSRVDQTVIDAVGELGNMVVGGAKRRLAGNNLTMSLPTVLRAGESALEFGTHLIPFRIHYHYEEYTLVMTIALRHN